MNSMHYAMRHVASRLSALALPLLLGAALVLSACDTQAPSITETEPSDPAVTASTPLPGDYIGHTVVLSYAEYITDPASGEAGGIEYFQKDTGNGQLSQDFVYNDPRNAQFDGGEPGVTFAVASGNTSPDANLENQGFWFGKSLQAWANLQCSGLNLTEKIIDPNYPGIVNIFLQTGQIPLIQGADVTQVGFFSPAEFPYFAANPNVLGVAFTLSWVDPNGNLTDIDGNGKSDVAFREIYYNDAYNWADNGAEGPFIDFPTVAIHEAGHGLSAAHFGNIGVKDGTLVANPRSIMNAIYGGLLRDFAGRDVSTHCSNWAQWPDKQGSGRP